jgi:hypothetical protein
MRSGWLGTPRYVPNLRCFCAPFAPPYGARNEPLTGSAPPGLCMQGTLDTQPILQLGLPYIQKMQIGMPHAERCTFWNELTDSVFDMMDIDTSRRFNDD